MEWLECLPRSRCSVYLDKKLSPEYTGESFLKGSKWIWIEYSYLGISFFCIAIEPTECVGSDEFPEMTSLYWLDMEVFKPASILYICTNSTK